MLGMAYGSRLALGTLLLYLAEGAAGLPVFAGTNAGFAYMIGPTGGYLIGFVRGCPGRCCKSEVGAAPPEPVGSGCSIHEEEQRREERYASIGFPDSPECSRDGGRRVGRGRGFRGSSKQL